MKIETQAGRTTMFDISKWVHVAGATVWYASWHAAVLAGVLLVVMQALRRVVPAGPRSLLWLVIFARLAMPAAPAFPFSVEAAIGRWNLSDLSCSDAVDLHVPERADLSPALRQSARLDRLKVEAPRRSVSGTSDSLDVTLWLSRLCLIGWLGGVAVLSVRYGWASIRLKRFIGCCQPVEEPQLRQLAEECRRQCGLIFPPVMRRAPDGLGASIVGLIRPVLLISDRTLRRHPAELRLILLHEMRHARVGDCWFALWIRLLCTIHWFNPLVWLSARAWQAERELACDAWVLRQAGANERRQYGRTLLAVLEETSGKGPTLLSIAMASPGSLIERRLRQVNRPPADSNLRRALAVVLAVILAATGLTDSVRSQSVAKQIPDANTSARNENSTGAAKTGVAEPQQFNVIVAAHAYLVQGKIAQNIVLTDWKLVTWEKLHSLLRAGAKGRPTTIEAYITSSLQFPNPKFNDLAKRFYEFHKEQGARVILVSAGSNASKRYDAIRNAGDLKTDRLPRRAGTLLLPDGRPAAGATVLLCEKSPYPCSNRWERRKTLFPLISTMAT
jgi:beta-lactamase regulating signal transducer with metallopeptidase domain